MNHVGQNQEGPNQHGNQSGLNNNQPGLNNQPTPNNQSDNHPGPNNQPTPNNQPGLNHQQSGLDHQQSGLNHQQSGLNRLTLSGLNNIQSGVNSIPSNVNSQSGLNNHSSLNKMTHVSNWSMPNASACLVLNSLMALLVFLGIVDAFFRDAILLVQEAFMFPSAFFLGCFCSFFAVPLSVSYLYRTHLLSVTPYVTITIYMNIFKN